MLLQPRHQLELVKRSHASIYLQSWIQICVHCYSASLHFHHHITSYASSFIHGGRPARPSISNQCAPVAHLLLRLHEAEAAAIGAPSHKIENQRATIEILFGYPSEILWVVIAAPLDQKLSYTAAESRAPSFSEISDLLDLVNVITQFFRLSTVMGLHSL